METNVDDVASVEDLKERVASASFIATLQAGYTDFHYLRPIWKETTEEEALIGVGLTGIGSNELYTLGDEVVREAANLCKKVNRVFSEMIGIKPAARTTTIKPSGTSSIVLGCSSGVHAWHAPYYMRRIRLGKDEAIYKYLLEVMPELVEDDYFNPLTQAVISIPQHAPVGSVYREEGALSLYERALFFNKNWIVGGHVSGDNNNNVSCTLSLKEDEWEIIGKRLWEDKNFYNGMSVLPYDGGSYKQAPFEDITKEQFEKYSQYLNKIDLTSILEYQDYTNLTGEIACQGGACEVNF